ncbi:MULTISPECIES: DegV family protein [unclassified Butyrivibrio]|uniref:DegV family protein n=1 Tax=unclassified Butyrivibrio TaxID=2639466 RepID=UPI0003B46283|nr:MULTISPECIES: DegV family protein [unclassified Butyrivibrio]
MILKRLFKAASDHNKTLQERLFTVIPVIGLFSMFLLIFIGIFVEDDIKNTFIISLCLIAFIAIVVISKKKRRVQTGATIIAVVLVVIMLPAAFIYGGGIYGGSPIWFVFGFAYIGITVEGRRKYVLLVVGAIMTGISYYIAYTFPEKVAQHTLEMAHLDSFASVVLVSFLITIIVLFQNQVYQSENDLIQQQKKEIEELSQTRNKFFSNVSHELRTPIDSILGFNELILRSANNDEIAENAENIKSASRLMLSLINDVLDMNKLESGKMEIVPAEYDLAGMLSETVNMVWESASRKGLALYVDVDKTIPRKLIGDDMRIEQILINLLSNAIKFTNEGSVKISVKWKPLQNKQISIIFSVEDTGMGIKRDNMPYLFDEFKRINVEQTKGISGTGLGLAIVKQLTEQMNGEIQVNSIYTKGSTFTVSIPQEIVRDEPIGEMALETLKKREMGQFYRQSFEAPACRILVVDDNMMNRIVTVKLLKDTKMVIDQAESGAECLSRCNDAEYDCIFMDIEMPEMDGVESLRQIRSQIGGLNRETPVIVLTAHSSADDQAMYRAAGFDGYLLKPISGEMLENTLLRVLPGDKVHRITPTYIDPEDQKLLSTREKLPILITTESAVDIPKEMISELRIPIIPLYIRTQNGLFLDGVEAETDGVLKYMKEGGADKLFVDVPSIQEYEDFFASHLSDAENIIHISMSGKAGGAYHVAKEAAASFDKVTVIDSESLSSGIGLLVFEAIRLAREGKSVQDCVEQLNIIKKRIHTSFLIDNIDYLIRMGRIKRKVGGFSRLFMLKPAVLFRDGRGSLGRMMMGSVTKCRKAYIEDQLTKFAPIDRRRLFITHSDLSSAEIEEIKKWVNNIMSFEEIIVQKESASMAAIHGSAAFGLLYMLGETRNNG